MQKKELLTDLEQEQPSVEPRQDKEPLAKAARIGNFVSVTYAKEEKSLQFTMTVQGTKFWLLITLFIFALIVFLAVMFKNNLVPVIEKAL